MYISRMELNNFRCFKGRHSMEFNEGMNFFVGNNNSGKTTIFKAVEFIQSGKNIEDWISKDANSEHVSVIKVQVETLLAAIKKAKAVQDSQKMAEAFCNDVKPLFEAIRNASDELEMLVDDELWPMTKYRELQL